MKYVVEYDLLYKGGHIQWCTKHRFKIMAVIKAWWHLRIESYGGTVQIKEKS